MARESFIQHRKSQRLVVIREDYYDLFAGDHCAAAVMSLLEHLTNNELQRMEMAEETGEPSIRVSMAQMVSGLMNLYSVRSIQKRLDVIITAGILRESQQRLGKIKEYLIDGICLNDCLAHLRVISNFADEEFLPTEISSEATSEATSAKTTYDGGGVKDNRCSVLVSVENLSPISPHSQPAKPTPEPTDSKHPDTGASSDMDLDGRVEDQIASKIPESQWRRQRRKAGKKPKRAGLAGSDASRRLREMAAAEAETAQGSNEGGTPVVGDGRLRQGPVTPHIGYFISRWNEQVGGDPVRWSNSKDGPTAAKALSDQDFVDGFDTICQKAKAIHAGTGEGFPSFRQLFATRKGTSYQHWWPLLNGEYDGLAHKNGKRPKTDDEAIAAILANIPD